MKAVANMTSPVRCSFCGKVYDLAVVTPTQRYADCTVFKTPCCGRDADDRASKGDFRRLPDERWDEWGNLL